MKKTNQLSALLFGSNYLLIALLLTLFSSCKDKTIMEEPVIHNEEESVDTEVIWHVKAIHPEGKVISIKALDDAGNIYDVKAIQDSDQRQFLDIKAFIGGKRLPVKMLVSDDQYAPVKAIGEDGTIYDIKGLNDVGYKMDIKGVKRSGNIIHIKAIDKDGNFYGVKAISPDGKMDDVKGVKMMKEDLELTLNGVPVLAHIKALPMVECTPANTIWHIKAIHPEGRFLKVKALDEEGNIYDVKAIQDSDQRHLLDVKAFIGDYTAPVKMLVSDDKFTPVKAIGQNGTIYDIKALTPGGDRLDVKGVGRSGNIIHLKAIGKDGSFYGVKAIAPSGQMNDVKGIKLSKEDVEGNVNGVDIYAHIKAIPQMN